MSLDTQVLLGNRLHQILHADPVRTNKTSEFWSIFNVPIEGSLPCKMSPESHKKMTKKSSLSVLNPLRMWSWREIGAGVPLMLGKCKARSLLFPRLCLSPSNDSASDGSKNTLFKLHNNWLLKSPSIPFKDADLCEGHLSHVKKLRMLNTTMSVTFWNKSPEST